MEVILEAIAAGAGTVNSAVVKPPLPSAPIVALVATKTGGSGNLDVKIQHSPNQVTWFDWVTFTQLVDASGQQAIAPTTSAFPWLRTVRTVGGSGVYDIRVFLDGVYNWKRG